MIDNDVWKKLEQLYKKNPTIKCSNATDEEIQTAQEEIRSMFSDFYRYFLKHHAVNKLGNWTMHILTPSKNHSIVDETRSFQRDIQIAPEYRKWHIIGSNEKGDLLLMNNRSEVWVLSKNGSLVDANKIAENFEQFLYQQL